MHIEGNIVVHQKDGPRTVIIGIADVAEHSFERVRMKVASSHFDNRAETAVVGAATRSLDYICLPPEYGVASEHTSVAIGEANFAIIKPVPPSRRIMKPAVAFPMRKTIDRFKASSIL